MLTVDKLSPQTKEKISKIRYDRIVEKHEGPFDWENKLDRSPLSPEIARHFPDYDPIEESAEFMEIGSYDVLLPVPKKHHKNITILNHFFSQDLSRLVVYLKDETYEKGMFSGYIAICKLISPENFYLATLYHEWFIVEHSTENFL
jgi:hypothetical protein